MCLLGKTYPLTLNQQHQAYNLCYNLKVNNGIANKERESVKLNVKGKRDEDQEWNVTRQIV